MPNSNQAFDSHLETWKREQTMPWQRVRRRIEISNLLRYPGRSGLRILDAGGGNGYPSIPLAQRGCQVVVADYSEAMITDFQRLMSELGLPGVPLVGRRLLATCVGYVPQSWLTTRESLSDHRLLAPSQAPTAEAVSLPGQDPRGEVALLPQCFVETGDATGSSALTIQRCQWIIGLVLRSLEARS